MEAQLSQKLEKLKTDFAKGKIVVDEMATKLQQDQQTLLRMAGAIQALEELTKDIQE